MPDGQADTEEAPMSAMGEQFLILEETAEALQSFDPELAKQFRIVNGLPNRYCTGDASSRHIRSRTQCSAGADR